jgi:pimeloyl-[acyl-carrier protein] methyl ester esterase
VSEIDLKFTSIGDSALPALVLVHGWGHHSGVWQPLVEELKIRFHIHLLDLPGYGDSSEMTDAEMQQAWQLESLLDALHALPLAPAIWCGWSLGGMLATLYAARHPERVSALVTIASNALFVEKSDWSTSMPAADYARFSDALKADAKTTLPRFLALVSQGSKTARADLRHLKCCAVSPDLSTQIALEASLNLLNKLDTRTAIATLKVPQLHIFGAQDALVPVAASKAIALLNGSADIEIVENAGHAVLLSHPQQVIGVLERMAESL